MSYILIEKSEDVRFPFRDIGVHKHVPVIRGFTKRRVDLQHVRFVEPRQLTVQSLPWGGGVIVSRVHQHDGSSRPADGGQQSFAALGGTFPGRGGSTKNDCGAQTAVAFGRQESELPTERVTYDGDPAGVDSGLGFQKRHTCDEVIQVVCGQHMELQALSSLVSLGRLLALQKVWHEGSLVRGKALTSAEKIQKDVTVLDEDGGEFFGGIRDRELARMRRIPTP